MRRFVRLLVIVLPILLLFAAFRCCGFGVNSYFKGETLYWNGIKYVETAGLHHESNTKIGKTDDGFTIYEVLGDRDHNYIVAWSFLDHQLYVRASYEKDRTVIEAPYLVIMNMPMKRTLSIVL